MTRTFHQILVPFLLVDVSEDLARQAAPAPRTHAVLAPLVMAVPAGSRFRVRLRRPRAALPPPLRGRVRGVDGGGAPPQPREEGGRDGRGRRPPAVEQTEARLAPVHRRVRFRRTDGDG